MEWVDGVILFVIVLTALGGLKQGFLRAFCSVAGLLLGLAVASWNYGRVAGLLMPFMHSESLIIHDIAMSLYQKNGIQANLDFEIKHQDIIKRFGRYPHRNKILGRASTKAEIEFLKQPGSGF